MAARSDSLLRLGQALGRIRTAHGLTQEQLALASGIQRSYVGELELGKRNPSVETMLRLIAPLEISLSQWFAEADL